MKQLLHLDIRRSCHTNNVLHCTKFVPFTPSPPLHKLTNWISGLWKKQWKNMHNVELNPRTINDPVNCQTVMLHLSRTIFTSTGLCPILAKTMCGCNLDMSSRAKEIQEAGQNIIASSTVRQFFKLGPMVRPVETGSYCHHNWSWVLIVSAGN